MTENNIPTEEKLREAYQKLATQDTGAIQNRMVEEDGIDEPLADVFVKFGKQISEDEFVNFVQNGDIPPVSLSDEEMEILQAGRRRRKKKGGGDDGEKAIPPLAILAAAIAY